MDILIEAEVIEVIYSDVDPTQLYAIKAKIRDFNSSTSSDSLSVVTAIPHDIRNVTIPLKGEIVTLQRGAIATATGTINNKGYFYTGIVNAQNSVHHNSIPTITKMVSPGESGSKSYQQSSAGGSTAASAPAVDSNFSENINVKPLQPYVGDTLLQGRYGNAIRFSSTSTASGVKQKQPFSGAVGSPIIIISNTTRSKNTNKYNDYVTESPNNDENILILASGQKLDFVQATGTITSMDKKGLMSWKSESWGNTPQMLMSSGRIVLNSNQKEIVAFGKTGIGLSTDGNMTLDAKDILSTNAATIELGTDADEPIICGNVFKSWIEGLIDAIGTITATTPQGPTMPFNTSPQWPQILQAKSKISTFLSEVAFVVKSTDVKSEEAGTFNKIPTATVTKASPEQLKAAAKTKEEAKSKVNNPVYTPAEKAAISDNHNIQEYILTSSTRLGVELSPDTLTAADIDTNADTVTECIYTGKVSDDSGEEFNEDLGYSTDNYDDDALASNGVYDYMSVTTTSSTPTTNDSYLVMSLSQESLSKGKRIATIAMKDISVVSPGSRVNQYLSSIGCKANMLEWSNGAVCTWTREAGLPTPLTDTSTAQGWYNWAKKTNRWSSTPVMGSIIVYGTKSGNKVNAIHLGVVVQIENGSVISIEGDNYKEKVLYIQPDKSVVLGYILPSTADIEAPVVSYDEDPDDDKHVGTESFVGGRTGIAQNIISILRDTVNTVLSRGQSHGKCARYTFNHAVHFASRINGKTLNVSGPHYSAGGNANSPAYHDNLRKLGYQREDLGTMTKAQITSYLASSKNHSIGDVVAYWCISGVPASKSCTQYGHTQLYTGGHQAGATSHWTTDNTNNYNKSFVYNSYTPNSQWRIIKFNAPIV